MNQTDTNPRPASTCPLPGPTLAATTVCAKWAAAPASGPCSLCGSDLPPAVGPVLVLEGTGRLVCPACGLRHQRG